MKNNRIYDMKGAYSGQLDGSHVHKSDGSYVGELNNGMVLNMFKVRTPLVPAVPGYEVPPIPPVPRFPFPTIYSDVSDDLFNKD